MTVLTQLPTVNVKFTNSKTSRGAVAAMQCAAACTSDDGTRGIIQHVLFTFTDGRLTMRSTDSYRANRIIVELLTAVPDISFIVQAKELLEALPKPTAFPAREEKSLTIQYIPGHAELDVGRLLLLWDGNMRSVPATPQTDNSSGWSKFPDIDGLFDRAEEEFRTGTTNDPIAFNPSFLAQISKEAKLIHKDRPLTFYLPLTPMKPATFSTHNPDTGIHYESLLMPVRIP